MLILTFGWAVWKSATVLSQNALPGPVVALCQNAIVTGPPLLEPPLSSSPPPQAAKLTAPNATTAATANVFLGAMNFTSRCESFGRSERGDLLRRAGGHVKCVGTDVPTTCRVKRRSC